MAEKDSEELIQIKGQEESVGVFTYEYPIFDETNTEITNPDLELGYLKQEHFTIHHNMIPEQWHYEVVQFEFADGEIYIPTGPTDPHIQIVDSIAGIFKYQSLEDEQERVVTGQTISPVIDHEALPAYDEDRIQYRYILYTEKELADRKFLAEGPGLLAEAQGTIEDLLLVIADLVGGGEE